MRLGVRTLESCAIAGIHSILQRTLRSASWNPLLVDSGGAKGGTPSSIRVPPGRGMRN